MRKTLLFTASFAINLKRLYRFGGNFNEIKLEYLKENLINMQNNGRRSVGY